MKNFETEKQKFLLKWKIKKDVFFKKYNAALLKKKYTKVSDINKFWNEKYKPKFEDMLKKMNEEYSKIYHKYH